MRYGGDYVGLGRTFQISFQLPARTSSFAEKDQMMAAGTVQRVKPHRSRDAIRVAYDDGDYDVFSLKTIMCSFFPSMNCVMTVTATIWRLRKKLVVIVTVR